MNILRRIFGPEPEPEPPDISPVIPLGRAIFCVNCEVFHDKLDPDRCPNCGSRASSRVDRWINRGAKAS